MGRSRLSYHLSTQTCTSSPGSRSCLGTNINLVRPSVSSNSYQPVLFLANPLHCPVIPYDNVFNLGPSTHHSVNARSTSTFIQATILTLTPHPLTLSRAVPELGVEKDGVLRFEHACTRWGRACPHRWIWGATLRTGCAWTCKRDQWQTSHPTRTIRLRRDETRRHRVAQTKAARPRRGGIRAGTIGDP
jgi:hypothetical protein